MAKTVKRNGRGYGSAGSTRGKLQAAVVEALEARRLFAANLVISEFLASNDDGIQDTFLNNEDWIEIHNAGDATANLNDYYLTDNAGNPEKWRFPVQNLAAGATLVVFASERNLAVAGQELHTNFKLDAGGEYLGLIRAADDTVQFEYSPTYPAQSTDISYGLSDSSNHGSPRIYFSVPTPGAANALSVAKPTLTPGHTFNGSTQVTIATTTPGATIYYTTNNAAPTTASTVYSAPIALTGSKVVRAIAVAPGYVNSPIASDSYTAVDSTVNAFRSNLPIVVLESFGTTFGDLTFVNASATFINTAGDGYADMLDPVNFTGRVGLRYRGSTSFSNYPKKQFAVEIRDEAGGDKNASILGMPADSDWVLYAPWTERSLMNNALAMDWARQMGDYASRIRFVEVYLNNDTDTAVNFTDDYVGVYILMEKPKIDDNRVDINEVLPTATTEPDITGGYFFKKDRQESGEIEIQVPGGAETNWQPFVMVEPAAPTSPQLTYLTNYLTELDTVMNSASFADPVNGYAKYIDIDSWVDFWIMAEFTKSADAFWLSTFYYKPQGGKISMGPVWDFNLAFGQFNYRNGGSASGYGNESLAVWGTYGSTGFGDQYGYFARLFDDPSFKLKVADRWQELRKTVFDTNKMLAEMDAYVGILTDNNGQYPVGPGAPPLPVPPTPDNAAMRNFRKWPVLGTYSVTNSYYDQQGRWIEDVNMMKNWIKARAAWFDTQFVPPPALSPVGGTFGSPTNVTMTPKQHGTPIDTVLLAAGAPARAVVPSANVANWQSPSFSVPAAWLSGTTPIGYDLSASPVNYGTMGLDVGAMRNVRTSVFTRVTFNVANPATVTGSLILRMKYDDGFVVWLNGVRVMEKMVRENYNFGPSNPTTGAYNEFAGYAPPGGSYAAVARDENLALQFAEFDISAAKSALVAGTNVLAIQGLNDVVGSDDLLLMPEIVSRTYQLTNAGQVYYTTDGSDPRNPVTGSPSATAQLYSSALAVNSSRRYRARTLSGGVWSGIADEVYNYGGNNLRVTELMYNPPAPPVGSPYTAQDFEFIEVKNTGASPLNLAGFQFTTGITFTFPNMTLAGGAYGVIVKNLAAFQSRYGNGLNVLGTFTGSLDNSGEAIAIQDGFAQTTQSFTFNDAWHPSTDGGGNSLVVVDANAPMGDWNIAAGWRASYAPLGMPAAGDEDVVAPIHQSANFVQATNEVQFGFNEAVSVGALGGVSVVELLSGNPVSVGGYGASANVVTLTFSPLVNGIYRITLPVAAVTDIAGNPMAGSAVFTFLHVNASQLLAMPSGSPTYTVNQLAIGAAAKFDLNDNDLVVRGALTGTTIGSWTGSAYTGVTGLIASGSNGGGWDGSGIVTSSPDALTGLTTLGLGTAADILGLGGSQTELWNGQTVDATSILIKYTYSGDANLDGVIDGTDYFFIDSNVGTSAYGYANGDFNYDGFIDGTDYFFIDSNIGTQGPPL